jgi:glycosyltransferase involved in cell wall biosynthesis
MNTLSIIIPAYNEENTIGQVLDEVDKWKSPGWSKEIIVVDDGSTDKTKQILEKWEVKFHIVYKKKNEGKGSAISEGLRKVTGDYILIQDADLEYSPKDYMTLLSPFAHSHVDVVYGSRFLGAHLSTMFIYELGNKFVTLMTNILYNTNITDMETGYKVFRKKVIEGITFTAKRFDFEPEFTAKVLKKGYQIYEVPISYFGRKFDEGKKLTWKDGFVALWTLLKYRFVQ